MMATLQALKSSFMSPVGMLPARKRRYIYYRDRGDFPLVGISTLRRSSAVKKVSVVCAVHGDGRKSNGEEPPESLFMKELRRRGMTPTSLLEETKRGGVEIDDDSKSKQMDGSVSMKSGVSTDVEPNLSDQRELSMSLNSEGLEGLIPRAKLLLTLGGTFFLAFRPFIISTVAIFSALYFYFGSTFIHDGTERTVSMPQYVDPYALLEDEMITRTAPGIN